ncbi:MAG: hypothetical protein ACYTFA_15375, partial [Planctomycetota bacterium]
MYSAKVAFGVLCIAGWAMIAPRPVSAAAVSWDGDSDGDGDGVSWSDPLNWSGDALPGASDDVTIDVGGGLTVTLASGTHSINTLTCPESLDSTGGSLSIAGTSSIATLTQSGGILRGPGTITVTSQLNWSGGNMSHDGGSVIVEVGATLNMSGSAEKTLAYSRTLQNNGTGTWSGDDMESDALWRSTGGGASVIVNDGTIRKSSAGTKTISDLTVQNNGVLDVQTGTLSLDGASGTSTGLFNVQAGATLEYTTGGVHTLDVGSNMSVAGTLRMMPGGQLHVNDAYTVATTELVGGDLFFNSAIPTTAVLNQSDGNLRGTGTITVTSELNWLGGLMLEAGITIVDTGATLNMSGSAEKYLTYSRTLRNNGTGTWSGDGSFAMSFDSTFHNTSDFDMESDALWRST